MEGHKTTDCRDKGKGKKCYNCGCFGHVSKTCRKPKVETKKDSDTAKPTMMIETTDEANMMIPVGINMKTVDTLLDTGSPYMDLAMYKQLRLQPWSERKVSLKGFAGIPQFSLGEIKFITVRNVTITIYM